MSSSAIRYKVRWVADRGFERAEQNRWSKGQDRQRDRGMVGFGGKGRSEGGLESR